MPKSDSSCELKLLASDFVWLVTVRMCSVYDILTVLIEVAHALAALGKGDVTWLFEDIPHFLRYYKPPGVFCHS